MSSLQSSEDIQVNEAVGAFSKLESEIGELVRRDATASRLQQGHDNELVSPLQSLDRIQVNEGAETFPKLESETGEIIRRDATAPRPLQENHDELVASNVSLVVQQVSGTSVQQIENLIGELRILRDKLHNEAARVQRRIGDYAALIQDAKKSLGTISESLSSWKKSS
jgi:hypothetical protein